jgi:hypothetical protein
VNVIEGGHSGGLGLIQVLVNIDTCSIKSGSDEKLRSF